MSENDGHDELLRVFAAELERLGCEVRRDVDLGDHMPALSSLSAIRPLLTSLSEGLTQALMSGLDQSIESPFAECESSYVPPGYL